MAYHGNPFLRLPDDVFFHFRPRRIDADTNLGIDALEHSDRAGLGSNAAIERAPPRTLPITALLLFETAYATVSGTRSSTTVQFFPARAACACL